MRRKIFMVWACFMLIMGAALPLERACAETLPVLVIGSDEYEPYNYVGADGTRQGVSGVVGGGRVFHSSLLFYLTLQT